ncbi:unnamed protein product, partial [Coregonus sp. 'balchen']
MAFPKTYCCRESSWLKKRGSSAMFWGKCWDLFPNNTATDGKPLLFALEGFRTLMGKRRPLRGGYFKVGLLDGWVDVNYRHVHPDSESTDTSCSIPDSESTTRPSQI